MALADTWWCCGCSVALDHVTPEEVAVWSVVPGWPLHPHLVLRRGATLLTVEGGCARWNGSPMQCKACKIQRHSQSNT